MPAYSPISWHSLCRASRRTATCPFHPQVASLQRPTFAMCDQLKSVSRERFRRRHSVRLQIEDVTAIQFVLHWMIDTC